MIKTIEEAIEFINDHTCIDVIFDDRLNFQSETKSLVLQDDDLDKLQDFLQRQEKEKKVLQDAFNYCENTGVPPHDVILQQESYIKELKAEMDNWKPKFEVGQEVWLFVQDKNSNDIIVSTFIDSYQIRSESEIFILDAICCEQIIYYDYDTDEDDKLYVDKTDIYATREEAELARGK